MYAIHHAFSTGQCTELTRKHVAEMFYNGELEKEIRSPVAPERLSWAFKLDCDREMFMQKLEEERAQTVYTHSPSEECLQKGIVIMLIEDYINTGLLTLLPYRVFRVFEVLCNGWQLETYIPPLHVPSEKHCE